MFHLSAVFRISGKKKIRTELLLLSGQNTPGEAQSAGGRAPLERNTQSVEPIAKARDIRITDIRNDLGRFIAIVAAIIAAPL